MAAKGSSISCSEDLDSDTWKLNFDVWKFDSSMEELNWVHEELDCAA
jgi:hypothetical protein